MEPSCHLTNRVPRNVPEVDVGTPDADRQEILNRLVLIGLGLLAATLGWILGARYLVNCMSGVAWWVSAWIVTVEGQSFGRLVPLAALVTALLVLVAARRRTTAL